MRIKLRKRVADIPLCLPLAEQVVKSPEGIFIQRTYWSDGVYRTIKENWEARVSWFRPPAIGIFKWAYKIKREVIEKTEIHPDDLKYTVDDYKDIPLYVDQKARGNGVTQIAIQVVRGGKDEC